MKKKETKNAQSSESSKNKGRRMMSIIGIVAIVIIVCYGTFINRKIDDDKKIDFSPDVSINMTKKIELSKEQETYNIDSSLRIEFLGKVQDNDSSNKPIYKYTADVYLDDNKILTVDNDNIYSANAAANFEVIRTKKVYILKSFVARQCNSDKINIVTMKGKVLPITDSAVDFDINKKLDKFTLTLCDSCMDSNCKIEKYEIVDDTIVKK